MSNSQQQRISLEFFPPKTDAGREKLFLEQEKLAAIKPAFYSVTYGAGGSTRDNTKSIVLELNNKGADVAPHLSFGNDTKDDMLELIQSYMAAGVKRIVALRGDAPSGSGTTRLVYANELVEFIRSNTGDHFELEVAAYPEIHPESESYQSDIQFLKQKLDAGANNAITQYFYSADAYFYFIDACNKAGIDKPIYPGIMPITNYENLARFSKSCGAEIPRWLHHKMLSFGDDKNSITEFGADVVTKLCATLLEGGAPGIHFYTMNQAKPTLDIYQRLGLSKS